MMTNEEALELIQKEYQCRKRSLTDCGLDCEECPLYVSDSDFVIALYHAIEAMEKQIPKKDIPFGQGYFHSCPNCGMTIDYKDKFCVSCGQSIDWSETEE